MNGYNPNFIPGFNIPLPQFSAELSDLIVRNGDLHGRHVAHYPNYSIVTRSDMRAPVFSALNIDQDSILEHNVTAEDGSRSWRYDRDVGEDYQLNNDYYRDNPWDRGHLAMRKNTAWGPDYDAAQRASKETYYWSNCSLQHKNFNQDEWQGLEMWVQKNLGAKHGRVTSFSLPIFEGFMRTVKPRNRCVAFIPAGYCKVVAFIDENTDQPEVRAFLMMQDADAIRVSDDQTRNQLVEGGRKVFNYQRYQVPTRFVTERTGVVFADALYARNPLYYYDSEATRDERHGVNARRVPEYVEVDDAREVITHGAPRADVQDDQVEVYLAAAMPDPEGRDRDREWVSVANFSGETIDFADWQLHDARGNTRRLGDAVDGSCVVIPGGALVVANLTPVILGNKGGVIILLNPEGQRVDRVNYHETDVKRNQPVNFFYQPSMRSGAS